MKTRLIASIVLLSLLTSALAIGFNTRPVGAQNSNVVLSINPTPVNKIPTDVNSFFDVYVNITGVTGLYGFDINVTWTDNTLIQIDQAASDTGTTALLNQIWGATKWFPAVDNASGGGAGGGYYDIAAVSTSNGSTGWNGDHGLMDLHFKIMRNGGNFVAETPIQIHTYKLSDPSAQPILATTTDGLFHIGATTPDVGLVLVNPTSKPFEYGKTFKIQVYVSHVSSQLTGYNFTILYDTELLKLTGVEVNGTVLAGGTYTENPSGTVKAVLTSGTGYVGDQGLLFTLVFHIEFDNRPSHIWTVTGAPNTLPAQVWFQDVSLIFTVGTISMSGITMPSALTVTVHLIQGDVNCDGQVNVQDMQTVAHFYDVKQGNSNWSQASKYNLVDPTGDANIIDVYDLVIVATNFGYGETH